MALHKEKKSEIIEKVKNIVTTSASVVFVNFHGLPVSEATAMRRTLAERGVGYVVAKKTLVHRALTDAKQKKLTGDEPSLPGELALAFGGDPVTPASSVAEFAKTFKDKITIIGGIFDNVFKSKEEMTEIAAIPSLTVLRGMFVNVINSPIQGFVVALHEIANSKK